MTDLVLLHGWGFGSHIWLPLAEQLAGTCRVHLADLPGYGPNVLAAADLPAGATVCAWSLGAFQAMQWAYARPNKVTRLVLVGATPRFPQGPDWPHAQPAELLAEFAAGISTDPAGALRRFAALLNRGDDNARPATRALTSLLAEGIPSATTLAAGLGQLRDSDLRALAPAIAQPTLLLHGEHDPLMPVAAAHWLHSHMANARLEVFADAAHAPFLSQPKRFADLLTEFTREP